MPNTTQYVFKRSLIAASILSLSACSTMQNHAPDVVNGVGSGIAKAGRVTADVGRKTWNTTTYLLGFSDSIDGENNSNATLSDDQLLLAGSDDKQLLPINQDDSASGPALIAAGTAGSERESDGSVDVIPVTEVAKAELVTQDLIPESAAAEDLVHVVAGRETLWDIAKLTTGDATNWHVLADINDLGQSATVFPGQELIIPADMVKPDYDPSLSNESIASSADEPSDSEASTSPALAAATQDQQDSGAQFSGTSFEVTNGENLWNFAKRTTGDATNWQSIANHNQLTEEQAITVQPGQTIFVPDALLRDELKSASASAIGSQPATVESTATVANIQDPQVEPEATLTANANNSVPSSEDTESLAAALPSSGAEITEAATEGSSELVAQSKAIDKQTQADKAVEIVDASYKTESTLNTSSSEQATEVASENTSIPSEIKVSGTYYPKAVYNDADFSASLLTRVSPGTTLRVSGARGTWYEVQTDKGVGYVHQRDTQ